MKNVVYEHTFGHFFAGEPGRTENLVAVCGGEESADQIVAAMNRPGISDAQPQDVYVAPDKTIWGVVGRCESPWIILDELDVVGKRSEPHRMEGGIGGGMWQGFKRIYRPEGI